MKFTILFYCKLTKLILHKIYIKTDTHIKYIQKDTPTKEEQNTILTPCGTSFLHFETGENPRNQTLSRIAIYLHNDNTMLATIMADVMVTKEIEDTALRLGVNLHSRSRHHSPPSRRRLRPLEPPFLRLAAS